jgi:hypothetical protein
MQTKVKKEGLLWDLGMEYTYFTAGQTFWQTVKNAVKRLLGPGV